MAELSASPQGGMQSSTLALSSTRHELGDLTRVTVAKIGAAHQVLTGTLANVNRYKLYRPRNQI